MLQPILWVKKLTAGNLCCDMNSYKFTICVCTNCECNVKKYMMV